MSDYIYTKIYTIDPQKVLEMTNKNLDYHALNSMLNLYGPSGELQLDKDKEAVRDYFLNHVNQNTVFFHTLSEKLTYLVEEGYYDSDILGQYSDEFIKSLFQRAYSYKFRFKTFLGAFKFFQSYALKTLDGSRYLERYEDRVAMMALTLADGDEDLAVNILDETISGRVQPATPTFSNTGKKRGGAWISCFLLAAGDSLESIGDVFKSATQLSKRGGGVGICLTNMRERGAPIKGVEGVGSGLIPYMKVLEDSFKWINQLGQRSGAGAVYVSACHPDIMEVLDCKRENADESIRIKTLSIGVVIPDIAFELARENRDLYLFSPYDVERVYGVPMTEISITEKYHEMVENKEIRKKKIKARILFQTIAELQFESGYPYILFEDNANRGNPLEGRIAMSNLCLTGDTQILTSEGYRTVSDLYTTQEDFDVVVDTRARDMDLSNSGTSVEKSSRMFKTAENADVYRLTTSEGHTIRATEWHKFYVVRDGELVKIPLTEVEIGDKVLVQSGEGSFGSVHKPDLAYFVGGVVADGTFSVGSNTASVRLDLYGSKDEFEESFTASAQRVLQEEVVTLHRQSTLTPTFTRSTSVDRTSLTSAPIYRILNEYGFGRDNKHSVPGFVKQGDRETQASFLNGLYQLDGTITGSTRVGSTSIELGSVSVEFLRDVQRILLNFGVYTRIYANRSDDRYAEMPDGRGGSGTYLQRRSWTLRATSRSDVDKLFALITWRKEHLVRWEKLTEGRSAKRPYQTHKHLATVSAVEFDGVEDVYDVTVDNGNSVIFNGIVTGNCSEILQVQTQSTYNEQGDHVEIGRDISCNLASLNIALALDGGDLEKTVEVATRALTTVSDKGGITAVRTVKKGNELTHSIGLGQMNLHGFLARELIHYGDEDSLEFASVYSAAINYFSLKASTKIAQERGETFFEFEKSTYADGSYFDQYLNRDWLPKREKVKDIFESRGISLPTPEDWRRLKEEVMEFGLYHGYRLAIPPTGSISYLNNSTSSIHPIISPIEVRKEGKIGRVYYPAPHLSDENMEYFRSAFDVGPEKLIDVYARFQEHTDQGLSLTLFFSSDSTTRDLSRAYIYAFKNGIKTLYYTRIRQAALEGTEVEGCVSCAL